MTRSLQLCRERDLQCRVANAILLCMVYAASAELRGLGTVTSPLGYPLPSNAHPSAAQSWQPCRKGQTNSHIPESAFTTHHTGKEAVLQCLGEARAFMLARSPQRRAANLLDKARRESKAHLRLHRLACLQDADALGMPGSGRDVSRGERRTVGSPCRRAGPGLQQALDDTSMPLVACNHQRRGTVGGCKVGRSMCSQQ